ncbi:MAG: hypothetical protein JJU23_09460 [Cyclobacteriaceae bacterium]|nr:hypothetical protein [Cyclobacteriaceae bacterium]
MRQKNQLSLHSTKIKPSEKYLLNQLTIPYIEKYKHNAEFSVFYLL